jgi:hypothetical protein
MSPGIHVFPTQTENKTWMAGTSSAKTRFYPAMTEITMMRNPWGA